MYTIIFYAGGSKGPNARADGKGGLLKRGWYVITPTGLRIGPSRTKRIALQQAAFRGAPITIVPKHTMKEA